MTQCKSIGCDNHVVTPGTDFCTYCAYVHSILDPESKSEEIDNEEDDVVVDLDTYAVHHAFNIQDPSGCLQRASRIILMSGQMNEESNEPKGEDILIAREMLTRWLQLNQYE